MGSLIGLVWLMLTFFVFSYLRKNTGVISFDGITGFMWAYLGMLIESGIISMLLISIPLIIIKYLGVYIFIVVGVVCAIYFLGKKKSKH